MVTINTGTERVDVEINDGKVHLFGQQFWMEKNFETIQAAKRWAKRNINLGAGDNLEDYILNLKEVK